MLGIREEAGEDEREEEKKSLVELETNTNNAAMLRLTMSGTVYANRAATGRCLEVGGTKYLS